MKIYGRSNGVGNKMLFVCFTLLKLKKQFVQQKKNMFSQRKSSLGTSMELQVYTNLHIWPPPMAIFLALWVWEGTGAIQDEKYLKWQ